MKIIVKSIPKFWKMEKSGERTSTVRTLDGNDEIKIVNTETRESFIRKITNIKIFSDEEILIRFKPLKKK